MPAALRRHRACDPLVKILKTREKLAYQALKVQHRSPPVFANSEVSPLRDFLQVF
jgi:hypothetical protein